MRRIGPPLIAFAAVCLGVVPGMAEPGFGSLRKKKIELAIRQPGKVRLANTSFALTGSSTNREYVSVQESLLATLETELISNEKTLIRQPVPTSADWIINVRITGFSNPQPLVQQVGAGGSSGSYLRWTGSLGLAYQVADRGGRAHDAGNVRYVYDKQFESKAKGLSVSSIRRWVPGLGNKAVPSTPEDVKQILIREVVHQIATRLGNTSTKVDVQVAGGDEHMNRAADFLENRLWARALEELQSTPPYAKPSEEAYRQYNLGLTYEAIAYDAKTSADQRTNLYKSQEYYDKALEMNRKEKYFIETISRTRDSLAGYKALEQMAKDDSRKPPVAPAKPAAVPVPVQKKRP